MAPKANSQLMDIKGKAYLKVPGRVEMFREDHPLGVITTELVHLEPRVIVRAVIHGADGTMIASGYGTAPMIGKGESTWRDKEIEKAETAAVGRALGFAGYGTLAAFAEDDRDNLADAPIEPPRKVDPRDQAMTDAIMDANTKANQRAAAANGWTREQANSLGLEAKRLNVSTDELLALLNVAKLSEYAPGFSAARDNLQKYARVKPNEPTQEPAF
jgi:hypothetical protein